VVAPAPKRPQKLRDRTIPAPVAACASTARARQAVGVDVRGFGIG
jgi:hypothetical protein